MEEVYIRWDIILKKLSNEISGEEDALLEAWLRDDPAHRAYYEKARRYVERYYSGRETRAIDMQGAWEEFVHYTRRAPAPWRWIAWRAAVVLLVLGAGWATYRLAVDREVEPAVVTRLVMEPGSVKAVLQLPAGDRVPLVDTSDWRRVVERATPPSPAPGEEPVVNSTVWVPRGGEYTLTLADGTVVMINAASRLRFPSAFPGDERRVYLEGEALFRVERDAGRPFFVETADGTVKVLGTEFNVNAYPDNATTRATLVSGSIAFRAREIPGERLLRPGEQVIHDRETRETRVERVNTALYTAWTTGRWIIEGERLEEIMKQFARWYDARVIYQDPRARDLVFTGDLEKYANGETVLNIISMTTNVDFVVREDNTVTVKMR